MSKEVNEIQDSEESSGEGNVTSGSGDGVRMVLWTRRPVCGPRTAIIDRLGELRSAGTIAAFEVETWPDEVAVSEHTRHTQVIETYERFRAWADETGVSIAPPFDRRTVTSLVGRTEEVLTLPVMCLAVYEDDLIGVYPCSDGAETWTVTDFLDACETEGMRPADVPQVPASGE